MKKDESGTLGDKALELIMRDVLDGLQELALQASHAPRPGQFEILNIVPVASEQTRTEHAPAGSKTRTRTRRRTADIVSFIEERERIAMRQTPGRKTVNL